MATYGITPAFANLVLGTLTNVPLTVPIVCAQLHNGAPGSAATANVSSAVSGRQQLTMQAPVSGATNLTGGNPSWPVTAADTLEALSLWNGFDGDSSAIGMFTFLLSAPVTIADGDTVTLNTATITTQGQAA